MREEDVAVAVNDVKEPQDIVIHFNPVEQYCKLSETTNKWKQSS